MVDEYVNNYNVGGRLLKVQIPLWSMNTQESIDVIYTEDKFRFLYGR